MTYYEIVRLDEDGKIDLPADSAYDIGASKDAYFLLEVSPEVKEARLERIALPDKELVEFEFILENKPGALSTISGVFAEHNVNIMFNETEDVNSDQGILISILDISNMDVELEELLEEVKKPEEVIEVSFRKCK